MSFESELARGRFCIPQCTVCNKTVWPPAEFCCYCFGLLSLKSGDFEGRIVEFSGHDKKYFCIVEFEDAVKIMASMSDVPRIGRKVRVSRCGVTAGGDHFFYVS